MIYVWGLKYLKMVNDKDHSDNFNLIRWLLIDDKKMHFISINIFQFFYFIYIKNLNAPNQLKEN